MVVARGRAGPVGRRSPPLENLGLALGLEADRMTITAGQKLVYVPRDQRWSKPREVIVERVGRKWANLAHNEGRVDIHTLELDGGRYSSSGRCFGTWEEYQEKMAVDKAWNDLRRAITDFRQRDPDVTAADIEEAMRLLRLERPA